VAQLVETGDINPSDLEFIRQTAAGVAPQKPKRRAK
jgi:hypothetical protein